MSSSSETGDGSGSLSNHTGRVEQPRGLLPESRDTHIGHIYILS